MSCRFTALVRTGHLLLFVGLLLGAPAAAYADEDISVVPSARIVGGLTVFPGAGGPSGVLGLDVGAHVQFGDFPTLGLTGEIGWEYEAGALPEGNYLTITLGADVGGAPISAGLYGTLLTGSASDQLSVGGRVSGRVEVLLGVFGVEVGYQALEIAGTLNHGVHVAAALDIGALLYGAVWAIDAFL